MSGDNFATRAAPPCEKSASDHPGIKRQAPSQVKKKIVTYALAHRSEVVGGQEHPHVPPAAPMGAKVGLTQALESDGGQHVALRPACIRVVEPWHLHVWQRVMPGPYLIWGCSRQRDHGAEISTVAVLPRDHNDRPPLDHLRGHEAPIVEVADEHFARLWKVWKTLHHQKEEAPCEGGFIRRPVGLGIVFPGRCHYLSSGRLKPAFAEDAQLWAEWLTVAIDLAYDEPQALGLSGPAQ